MNEVSNPVSTDISLTWLAQTVRSVTSGSRGSLARRQTGWGLAHCGRKCGSHLEETSEARPARPLLRELSTAFVDISG